MKEEYIKYVVFFIAGLVALLIVLTIPKFLGWLYDAPPCTEFNYVPKDCER
jgi:hypothetical protein